MCLRIISILSLSHENFGDILYFRSFPTVEKRCKIIQKEHYKPFPDVSVFADKLLLKLGFTPNPMQRSEWCDKMSNPMQFPVTDLCVNNEKYWPVVFLNQSLILIYCLPFVEEIEAGQTKDLTKIPSISFGFSLLNDIFNFLNDASFQKSEQSDHFVELDQYLSMNMPFGKPTDIEPYYSSLNYFTTSFNFPKKQISWKSFDFKGKPQFYFHILEGVKSFQSDQSNCKTVFEVFGHISVKTELEEAVNDISISFGNIDTTQPLLLDSLIFHPCVKLHSSSLIQGSGLKRIRFSPLPYSFNLLYYRSMSFKEPPIEGVFKMLGENSVELLIQLKLNEKVKNNFEFCDVVVFFNRGPVKNMEYNASYGFLKFVKNKHALKWKLGQKFPKDLEVALTAKLEFDENPLLLQNDQFCVKTNCFAQIYFKQSQTNLSGCCIDPKSVVVSPFIKPKIIIERSLQAHEYRLWNTYGDLPFPTDIENKSRSVLFQK